MVTFDEVLPLLASTCEAHPGFSHVRKAVAVRDLRGRVRLVLDMDPKGSSAPDVGALGASLTGTLGPWFEPPVLNNAPSVGSDRIPPRIAKTVLAKAEAWEPSWHDVVTGGTKTSGVAWGKLERHLSKQAWTTADRIGPPWPLVAGKPAIVTFYSFKGGVGRTTLLASIAWQLAALGKRVLVLDLDVEAPGVGVTLGALPERGILDFLVDHAAIGRASLDGLRASATALGDDASLVQVIHAGSLNSSYFEKLARLDFGGSGFFDAGAPPVGEALRALLAAVARGASPPDFVLIDSRAGLHDIAGLSLHDLAHVDVLVGRDDGPSMRGMELVLEAVGKLRRSGRATSSVSSTRRFVTVYAMAPSDPKSPERDRGMASFRSRAYQAFNSHLYVDDLENAPGELTDDADHQPLPVSFDERLLRYTELASVKERLLGAEYAAILERLLELCAPEDAPMSDEEDP